MNLKKNDRETINKMYEDIADELNVPDSVVKEAEDSYKAVGDFISNKLSNYDVSLYPQGSMNLGTLIKPVSDEDDYDLDIVCLISGDILSPKELKELVGNVLRDSDRYKKLLQDEGKRCWTLKYADSRHFHMDILPSMPNEGTKDKSIIITHKENNQYEFMISNPEDYAQWFSDLQKNERKLLFERAGQSYSNDIADLRKYGIRTTLQKTVQILKRHRDIKYKDATDEERDNKPISIIITTLLGKMYTGQEDIVGLILKFVNEHEYYMEKDEDGNYFISNPVNSEENFADKWKQYPVRKEAFFDWVKELKNDLLENNFLCLNEFESKANHLKEIFGESVVNSVYEKRIIDKDNMYVKRDDVATLTNKITTTKVKEHNFYGA